MGQGQRQTRLLKRGVTAAALTASLFFPLSIRKNNMTSWFDAFVPQNGHIQDKALLLPSTEKPPSCALMPLLGLDVVRCEGEEAVPFLHSLCSNDIKGLTPGQLQWNSFNTPKGRMLANFLVRHDQTGLRLYTHADLAGDLATRLSRYVLRAKARIGQPETPVALFGLVGSQAAEALRAAALPVPAPMQWTQTGSIEVLAITTDLFIIDLPQSDVGLLLSTLITPGGAQLSPSVIWEQTLIREGLFWLPPSLQEAFVAQMLNYDVIGGVSFRKGCYPGQEIIARTRYLGKVKKRLFRVAIPPQADPHIGDPILSPVSGEQSAGKLVAVAATSDGFEALVVAPVSCALEGELFLKGLDGPRLTTLTLPYAIEE
jgi:tRNA-modifying protein YgfZ